MKASPTSLPGVLLLEPRVFGDPRGFFLESYNRKVFEAAVGRSVDFVQDNHSRSVKGVLRGLHYQTGRTQQAKLVRVIEGEILDVAVDVRRGSATLGQWTSCRLSAQNKHQFWIPEGFAHGFLVLSETAEVLYKTNAYYAPADEQCIAWNDPAVGISWGVTEGVSLSDKDRKGRAWLDAELMDVGT